jgi:hypothetical protein
MKRLSAVLFVLLLVSLSHAQQRWTKTYGGTGVDFGNSVQQTPDSGYIVTGYNSSSGNPDVWLIKTSASGDTLWTRIFGGTQFDEGTSVTPTVDGGYILAGWTYSFGAGSSDAWLIKTDASGDSLWTRTYGGPSYDFAYSVQQTPDSGYIVAGYTYSFGAGGSDVWLIKTDAKGDTLWTRTYGGANNDFGESVQQTRDGGYVITGWTQSFGAGNDDVYLIKTDAKGDTLWTRTYGGANNDYAYAVQQTSDGGFIVAGVTNSFGAGGADVWLLKTDASGDTLWTRTYGGTAADQGWSVQQTTDRGFIVAGVTMSFSAGQDVYLIKTDSLGNTLWTKTYGGSSGDEARSVRQTSDGGYILAGGTQSFGAGLYDVYLIKTDANGSVGIEKPVRQLDGSTVRQLKATPNPFTSFATIPGHEGERFSVYDISGRKVGTYKGDRIGEGLAAGVYFVRSADRAFKPLRIVKVR